MTEYGTHPDEIQPFFQAKRRWSKVKDKIIGDYVTSYLKIITRRGRPIIIVDAFAGPGRFGDGSAGSPLIICKAIREATTRADVGIGCLFADVHPAHRRALRENLSEYIRDGIAENPLSTFSEVLTRALQIGSGSTLFFYLDPFGIKDLGFNTVRQIYERNKQQSTELLINFSFRTFMRMSGNWGYNDTASEVTEKVRSGKIETVNSVMGGDYWRDIVTDPNLDKTQREDAVVDEYLNQLRTSFNYTCSIPVDDVDDKDSIALPGNELAKYGPGVWHTKSQSGRIDE